MKSLIRDQDTYAVRPEEFDEARKHVLGVEASRRPRAERVKILTEYIVAILDAFERATMRRLVVSAFGQAGILYKFPDPQNPHKRVAYVDPTEAQQSKRPSGFSSDGDRLPVLNEGTFGFLI